MTSKNNTLSIVMLLGIGLIVGIFLGKYDKSLELEDKNNWQCIEWKNETKKLNCDSYTNYNLQIKCLDKYGFIIEKIDRWFEGTVDTGEYYEEVFINDSCYLVQYSLRPYQVGSCTAIIEENCVKEGLDCKKKYIVECFSPYDIMLFKDYNEAINYCKVPFKLETKTICKEYRDLK